MTSSTIVHVHTVLGNVLPMSGDNLLPPSSLPPQGSTSPPLAFQNPLLADNSMASLFHTALPPPPPQHTPLLPSAPPNPPTDAELAISEELHGKCVKQFTELTGGAGLLQGGPARNFFIQSHLPNHELSAIW